MTATQRALLVGGWLVLAACQRHGAERARANQSPSPRPSSPPASLARAVSLPEDPEPGARSVAQWRAHLEEEERERRLSYDRRRLNEHRLVSSQLRATQRSYDLASNERSLRAAEKAFHAAAPRLERSFDAIDHHGVSSRVIPEYRALAASFATEYPAARLAALSGSRAALEQLQSRTQAQFQRIDQWLEEAARSEDE